MKTGAIIIALFVLLGSFSDAMAKEYIDLSAPTVKRIPLAIGDLTYMGAQPRDTKEAAAISEVKNELSNALSGDLAFSNLFNIIDSRAFIEDPSAGGISETEMFKRARAGGADTYVKGGFLLDREKLTVELRFFDCVEGKQILGKRYTVSSGNPRRLIHYFSDQLYEELTGKKGVFTTKLLFVSNRTGNKEIYLSDYDGRGAVQITRNGSINLSPQWSPDGKKVLYASYKKGWPCLFILDLRTGRDTAVSDKKGINIGGRFSPDGGRLALTLSTKKSPGLFLLDLNTGVYRQLTDNYGIAVSPAWSPDGQRLAYVSDSAGNPHIFMLDLATGETKRLTYDGRYNSSPAWSPDGKTIAFSRSDNGLFNIWTMKPDGSGLTQLTFERDNRSPSWSPDSRYIVFSSESHGVASLYIMLSDGTGLTKLDTGRGSSTSPAWSPFLQ